MSDADTVESDARRDEPRDAARARSGADFDAAYAATSETGPEPTDTPPAGVSQAATVQASAGDARREGRETGSEEASLEDAEAEAGGDASMETGAEENAADEALGGDNPTAETPPTANAFATVEAGRAASAEGGAASSAPARGAAEPSALSEMSPPTAIAPDPQGPTSPSPLARASTESSPTTARRDAEATDGAAPANASAPFPQAEATVSVATGDVGADRRTASPAEARTVAESPRTVATMAGQGATPSPTSTGGAWSATDNRGAAGDVVKEGGALNSDASWDVDVPVEPVEQDAPAAPPRPAAAATLSATMALYSAAGGSADPGNVANAAAAGMGAATPMMAGAAADGAGLSAAVSEGGEALASPAAAAPITGASAAASLANAAPTGASYAAPAQAASVAGQIGAALLARGDDRRILLQLDPAELGRVAVELNFQDDGVSVTVRAERPEAMELIRRNAAELERALQDAGLDFTGLDLSADNGGEQGWAEGRRESLLQEGFSVRGGLSVQAGSDEAAELQSLSARPPSAPAPGRLDLRI